MARELGPFLLGLVLSLSEPLLGKIPLLGLRQRLEGADKQLLDPQSSPAPYRSTESIIRYAEHSSINSVYLSSVASALLGVFLLLMEYLESGWALLVGFMAFVLMGLSWVAFSLVGDPIERTSRKRKKARYYSIPACVALGINGIGIFITLLLSWV